MENLFNAYQTYKVRYITYTEIYFILLDIYFILFYIIRYFILFIIILFYIVIFCCILLLFKQRFQFVIYEKFCSYIKLLLSEILIVLVQLPFVTNPFYPSTSLIRKKI